MAPYTVFRDDLGPGQGRQIGVVLAVAALEEGHPAIDHEADDHCDGDQRHREDDDDLTVGS